MTRRFHSPAITPAVTLTLAAVLQATALAQLGAAEESKLFHAPEEDKDAFGWSVAIDGEIAAIGAPQNGLHWMAPRPGFVVVYEQRVAGWAEIQRLQGDSAQDHDHFGYAIDLVGDTLVVGAPQFNLGGPTGPGKVYVFERAAGGWNEVAEIAAANPLGDMDLFGYSVAFDGERLYVGAPALGAAYPGGRVHVLRATSGGWIEEAALEASDTTLQPDAFGSSLEVSGSTLVVGAPAVDAVYAFERSGTAWSEVQKLTGSGGFGESVAIDGDTLLVGAPRHGSTAEGAVFEFVRGGDWQLSQALSRTDVQPFDAFGCSIALRDGVAVIGAHEDYHFGSAKGKAYFFERGPGGWTQRLLLEGSDPDDDSGVGWDVAHDDRRVLLGAPFDEPLAWRSGSAYVLAVLPASSRFCTQAPSSLGAPAVLSVYGTDSISANGLALEAAPAPPGAPAIILLSPTEASVGLPGGRLCLGAPRRLAMTAATPFGRLLHSVDLGSPPAHQVTAGSTWHFQAWFRDPGSTAGYALSSAARVVFRP